MKEALDRRIALMSIALLGFLAIVAGYIWLLDPLTQQKVFGFFAGAELVAFSMLAYIYYKGDFDSLSKPWLLLASSAIIYLMILSTFVSG